MGRGKDSARGVVLDGTGQHSFAALMTEHRLQQKCRGRLAVGSGYAAEFKLLFGVGEEICGNSSQRAPSMRHLDYSYFRIRGCGGEAGSGVSDNGSRTLCDRLRDIAIAIRGAAAKSDKERAVATRRESYSTPITAGLGPARRMRSTPRKTLLSSTERLISVLKGRVKPRRDMANLTASASEGFL